MRSEPVLSPILEGVQFEVPTAQGGFKAFVSADLLMECFGAGPSPQSWLSTFREYIHDIERAALAERQAVSRSSDWVVLRMRRSPACDPGGALRP